MGILLILRRLGSIGTAGAAELFEADSTLQQINGSD
jgi:hypothetical protein